MTAAKYSLLRRAFDSHAYEVKSRLESGSSEPYYRRLTRKVWILAVGVFLFVILVGVAAWRTREEPPFPFRTRTAAQTESICKSYEILYKDAIDTHQWYKERGGIHLSDLEASREHCNDECMQIKLYDMNLYVGRVSECYESRAESLLMLLNMAIEQARMEGEQLPDFDVCLLCHDEPKRGGGTRAMWYASKSLEHIDGENGQDNLFLMPSFNFYSWPESFNEPWTRGYRHLPEVGRATAFRDKDRRMFWRGVTETSPSRKELLEITRNHTDVADIVEMRWSDDKSDPAPINFVSSAEMCSWKYIIYTEGWSYSGRLKYNMLCTSVIIGPQPFWIEFWTHLVVPGFNYVAVSKNWTNLISTHAELEKKPSKAYRIAQNAQRTMEYLDPRGVTCYTRELIRRYADVCDWVVEAPHLGDERNRRVPGRDWMGIEDYFLATRRL